MDRFSTNNGPQGKPDTLRRSLLRYALPAALGSTLVGRLLAATQPASSEPAQVTIEAFSAAGKSLGVSHVAKVIKTEAAWRAQLSELAFHVTRQEGTEAAFSGQYASNHADGLYRCICCDTALFDSRTKYDSGTGWPSFWKPISALNVVQKTDSSFMMLRQAVACRRCDAHLGHVFDDGPKPTGLRYCMNSVALHFLARA